MLSPTFACFSSKLQQISRYIPLLRRCCPTPAATSSVQSSLPQHQPYNGSFFLR
ncbi:hypothetical protein HanIR_Chr16g0832091 [Helianthus annuus]|nr:hypothetical protein HanIR_Chr16g0832091 [Helianthus annuus]